MKLTSIIIGLMTVVVTAGCGKVLHEPIKEPRGHYYLDPRTPFSQISRVALLEMSNESSFPELSDLLAQSLAAEISKKHLFALSQINRSDPIWNTMNLDQIAANDYEGLAMIDQELNVDAIIFGTIKRYETYPRMMLGLHLKMVDVREGRLIWAIEQFWDSTDKQVELRMQRFYSKELRTGYEPMNWQVVNTSPRAFNKFIAFEVAQTLPRLSAAAPTAEGKHRFVLDPDMINPLKYVKIN